MTSVVKPPGVVTVTITAPAEALLGAVTVSLVALLTTTEVPGTPPKATVVTELKFVPVMTTPGTVVFSGPSLGEIENMVGAARYVNPPANVAVP